jgi:hypothetical protein
MANEIMSNDYWDQNFILKHDILFFFLKYLN